VVGKEKKKVYCIEQIFFIQAQEIVSPSSKGGDLEFNKPVSLFSSLTASIYSGV